MNFKDIQNDPRILLTGRLSSYLENPDRGTLPVSCTTIKPRFRHTNGLSRMLGETINHAVISLATAAGVNIHLDNFWFPGARDVGDLILSLHPDHPDSSEWEYADYMDKDLDNYYVATLKDSLRFDKDIPGDMGIIDGLCHVFDMVSKGQNVLVIFDNLRPKGQKSSKVVSSGPQSFAHLFDCLYRLAEDFTVKNLLYFLGQINLVIRRGGYYKNGAITTSMPLWHPNADDYLDLDPSVDHPGLQKGIVIPKNYEDFPRLILDVIDKVNFGFLWMEQAITSDRKLLDYPSPEIEDRLLANVCREVFPENKGTCMLSPVNLGQCVNPGDIKEAMVDLMEFLCKAHSKDLVSSDLANGIYLSSEEDKQVGLGYIGLANLLAIKGIKYRDFIDSFERAVDDLYQYGNIDHLTCCQLAAYGDCSPADKLACEFIEGVLAAADVAKKHNMVRAFAIAPTASISYRGKDKEGFTTTPEISPPISDLVERISPLGNNTYQYHPNVETAKEVGFNNYFRLVNTFQKLHEFTGLAHAISFNIWEDINLDWIEKWMNSNIRNTYYKLTIENDFLDKTGENLQCNLDGHCTACDES